MNLIDSHVHFWDPAVLTYDWLSGQERLDRPFLPADYAKATAGTAVDGIVFVQADCRPDQGMAEVRWVTELDNPLIKAIVAFAPLEQGKAVGPYLEQLSRHPQVKGVRRLIQGEAADFAARPGFVHGVQRLADTGLTCDICIKHHQLPAVVELVESCPTVRFVLDHIGKPDIVAGDQNDWRAGLKTLAAYPNVWCKLSGVITEADWDNWRPETIRPFIDHALHAFGVERVLFGSDWPVVNLAGSFGRWFDALSELTIDLSKAEKERLFAQNCRDFYQFGTEE